MELAGVRQTLKKMFKSLFPFIATQGDLVNSKKAIEKSLRDLVAEKHLFVLQEIERVQNEIAFANKMKSAIERGMLYCLAYRIKVLTEKLQYSLPHEILAVEAALKKDFTTLSEDELKTVIKTIYNEG